MQLGGLIGSKQSTISEWETNKVEPQLSTLRRIAEALKVNLEWLITGQGGMEPDKTLQDLSENVERVQQPPSHLRDLATRGSIRRTETASAGERIEISTPPDDVPGAMPVAWLPVLGVVPGGPPFDPSLVPLGMLPVPADLVRHPRAFALRVMGYSMTPLIDDGDIIACEPYQGERLPPGSVVVAMVQGETTVKLYVHRDSEHLLLALSGPTKPIILGEGDSIIARVALVSRGSEALAVTKYP